MIKLNTLYYALFINVGIIISLLIMGWITKNPLVLLGMFFLQPLSHPSYSPDAQPDDEDGDDEPTMGFTANL